MRVMVAGTAGFCWGVQRALRLLDGVEGDGKRTVTLGPLVYNGPVLMQLQERSIAIIERPDQAGSGDRVALRPHGATRIAWSGSGLRLIAQGEKLDFGEREGHTVPKEPTRGLIEGHKVALGLRAVKEKQAQERQPGGTGPTSRPGP